MSTFKTKFMAVRKIISVCRPWALLVTSVISILSVFSIFILSFIQLLLYNWVLPDYVLYIIDASTLDNADAESTSSTSGSLHNISSGSDTGLSVCLSVCVS